MTTRHDFGSVVGWPFGHFSFGLSQFHGHGSWLVCEVAVSMHTQCMHGDLELYFYVAPSIKQLVCVIEWVSINDWFLRISVDVWTIPYLGYTMFGGGMILIN